MCIYYKDVHQFDDIEMNITTIVANQAAIALTNARLFSELSAERNKTFATIQSLNDGLIMYDLEGKITLFNPEAEKLLWISAEDALGKDIRDEKLEKENIYWQNLQKIGNLKRADFDMKEFTTEGPQKSVLQVTSVPVHDQNNQKIGVMQILRDITKEKELELLKTNFISTASHQLRTPLSAIKWSLNMLIKEDLGKLNREQEEIVQKTSSANQRLINLVNDLLDASRIEEGRFGYNFAMNNLEEITARVVEDAEIYAKKNKIKIILDKPKKPLPQINADPDKLNISIKNVVDNAIKYTKPGGSVDINFQAEKTSLFLIVRDNGIGIPQEDQKFIFAKFFRAKNAIRMQTEGSGLGLYIAKSIVEKHNAAITFESTENKGSTFTFQFPLNPEKMPKGLIQGL